MMALEDYSGVEAVRPGQQDLGMYPHSYWYCFCFFGRITHVTQVSVHTHTLHYVPVYNVRFDSILMYKLPFYSG